MNKDLDRAIEILNSGGYTCVLCKNDIVYTSKETGIKPMMQLISKGIDLKGFSAADKIVGKAAAMLFKLVNVKVVYGEVMSEKAADFLDKHDISATYRTLTPMIINRMGTDICPMEKTVIDIDDPNEAYLALIETIKRLKAKQD